ncbi:MAG: amidohydrolase [Anaerolineales bacterium]|nr:amidohydrolase [Anaerolineales bacterium]
MKENINVDVLIKGGTILTVDQKHRVIQDGAITITGDSISGIYSSDEIPQELEAGMVIQADGKVILPGLINAHSHLAMTLFRGFVEDLVLQQWLERVWKYEFSVLDDKAVRAGSKLALVEMIKNGITCAHDMYWHFEQTMEAAEEFGFRLLSGPPITGLGDQAFDEMFAQARKTLAWLDSLEFVYPIIQAHSTYTTTPKMMHTVREFKEEYGITFTTHASENQAEVETVLEQYQQTPIHLLASYDLLDESTLLAHCVVLDDEEIELLAKTGTHVVHCPESNLKIGSGIAPIAAMLEKGINVCIGTDGAASNNDLDILGELRTAALLQKGSNRNPELLNTKQALEMGTINGAKAYRLENDLGSLEKGKKADLVIINFDKPHLTPVHNPAANLIYSSGKSDVETVFINGKLQLENGQLTAIDEEQIMAEVRSISEKFV